MAQKKDIIAAAAADTMAMFKTTDTLVEDKPMEEEENKPIKEANAAEKSLVFSCRLSADTIAACKAYSKVTDSKVSEVVEAALKEYMKKHTLTEAENSAYMLFYNQNLKR